MGFGLLAWQSRRGHRCLFEARQVGVYVFSEKLHGTANQRVELMYDLVPLEGDRKKDNCNNKYLNALRLPAHLLNS